MANTYWWNDPPRNNWGCATARHDPGDGDYNADEIIDGGYFTEAGFLCDKKNTGIKDLAYGDDYWCRTYIPFIRFPMPPDDAAGTITSAELYLRITYAEVDIDTYSQMYLNVYHRFSYDSTQFPWNALTTDQYPSGGEWANSGVSSTNIYEAFITWANGGGFDGGDFWFGPIDVTAGVLHAQSEGWDRCAFSLEPSLTKPVGWDYDNWPGFNEEYRVFFAGANTNEIVTCPDSDFPTSTTTANPWLKITYNNGESQYWTPSAVTCLAADPKSSNALAGTESGSLWLCHDDAAFWNIMYEFETNITAVYMDNKRNFMDYPDNQVSWVATSGGLLYKSDNSLQDFSQIINFSEEVGSTVDVVEIGGNHLNSDRVAVATDDGKLWTTTDGGYSWRYSALSSTIDGIFVRGDEIQVMGSILFKRSPDFGVTWHNASYDGTWSYDGTDVVFNASKYSNSLIGGVGRIYKVDSTDGYTYGFTKAADITGTVVQMDADPLSQIALVATDSKLYKVAGWGEDVYNITPTDFDGETIVDMAIGGQATAFFSMGGDPISGTYSLPSADIGVSSGTFSWKQCTIGGSCYHEPDEEVADGLWYLYARGDRMDGDDTGDKYLSWGNLYSTNSIAYFWMDDYPTLPDDEVIDELQVELDGSDYDIYTDYSPILRISTTNYIYGQAPGSAGPAVNSSYTYNYNTGKEWTESEANAVGMGCVGHAEGFAIYRIMGSRWTRKAGENVVGANPHLRPDGVNNSYLGTPQTVISPVHPAEVAGIISYVDIYVTYMASTTSITFATFDPVQYTYDEVYNLPRSGTWVAVDRHTISTSYLSLGFNRVYCSLKANVGSCIGFFVVGSLSISGTNCGSYSEATLISATDVTTPGLESSFAYMGRLTNGAPWAKIFSLRGYIL